MNNIQKEKLANQRKIQAARKKKTDLKSLRLLNFVFFAISIIATWILFWILFSGGSIASIATTGPLAILLIPAIIIAALVALAIVVAYVCFINSIINTYATTVENIQTITDILVKEHASQNADTNESATTDNTTSDK